MLQDRRQLSQLWDHLVVDLVEGEEQPGSVGGEEIAGGCELGAKRRRDLVRFARLPRRASEAHRSGDALHLGLRTVRIDLAQKRRQVLVDEPMDQPGRRRLGDDPPPLLAGEVLVLVLHHGLPGSPRSRV